LEWTSAPRIPKWKWVLCWALFHPRFTPENMCPCTHWIGGGVSHRRTGHWRGEESLVSGDNRTSVLPLVICALRPCRGSGG
jgi:hypothetical protein